MEITIVIAAAVVAGLVEMLKQLVTDKRLYPVLALAVGVAVAFIAAPIVGLQTWQEIVLNGLIMGLTAMGLYSGGMTVTQQER